jgi:hypothetical protein
MRNAILCLCLSLIALLFLNLLLSAKAKDMPSYDQDILEIRKELNDIALRLNNIEERLDKWAKLYDIADCESKLDHNATGDNGRAFGILQFHKQTFDWLSRKAQVNGDYFSKRDQIALGLWAFDNGYGYLWTCYKKKGETKNGNNG